MGTTFAFLILVIALVPIGGLIGFLAHEWKSQFIGRIADDDDLASDLINQTMADRDYMFEKYVVGAKWDEDGFWDQYSRRNIIYFVGSGALVPIVIGFVCWPQRAAFMGLICVGMSRLGLHSPLCF